MAAPLTEYERLRQERLERNKLLLGSLGVIEAKEELKSALPPPRVKPKRVLGDNPRKRAPADSGSAERRVSLRQRGLPPSKDGGDALPEDAEAAGPRPRPSKEAQGLVLGSGGGHDGAGLPRGGRAREDTLELRSLNATLAEDGSLARLLLRLDVTATAEHGKEGAVSGPRQRTPRKETKAELAQEQEGGTDGPAGDWAEDMAVTGLTLAQEDVAKVCRERIHNVLFLPTTERVVVVAGDKGGQLAIWNVHPHHKDYESPALCEEEASGSRVRESKEGKAVDHKEEDAGDGCQGLHTFLVHDSVVSGLAVPAWDHHAPVVVYSCSYDGSVRGLDAQAQACPLLLGPTADSSSAFSALGSTPFLPQCLLLGTENGELLLLDTRAGEGHACAAGQGRGSIVGRWEAHSRKLNTVSACTPSASVQAGLGGPLGSAIVTASTDNSVKLWDLRKMQASKWLMVRDTHQNADRDRKAEAADAPGPKTRKDSSEFLLRRVKNPAPLSAPRLIDSALHSRGVNAAFFSPDGSKIVSTSYDDTIRVWDAQPWSSPGLEERARIRHNNHTGRWIASFRAVWACDSRHVIVGGMGRSLDVLDVQAAKGKGAVVASLQSAEFMTTIPARCATHPSRMMFAGASASGRVYLWRHKSDA